MSDEEFVRPFEACAIAGRDSPSILDRYYTRETLASDLARRTFVLPDGAVGRATCSPPWSLG